jgi:hypothetical protein
MKKYSEYLADKEREKQEAMVAYPYTDNEEINHLRQLVEDMSRWMVCGGRKQNTPINMITEFKATMKKANVITRTNKKDRGEFDE